MCGVSVYIIICDTTVPYNQETKLIINQNNNIDFLCYTRYILFPWTRIPLTLANYLPLH